MKQYTKQDYDIVHPILSREHIRTEATTKSTNNYLKSTVVKVQSTKYKKYMMLKST
jgi:hypothetical protein